MKNKILTLVVIFSVLTVNGQVQLNNAVLHNNGATLYVDGMNTVSNGGTINNFGNMHFGGDFTNTNVNDTLTNVALTDTVFIAGDLNISNGYYNGNTPYFGALVMNGTGKQTINTRSANSDAVYNLVINNGSTLGVDINGNMISENSIRFIDGNFNTNSTDTLALATGGNILGAPSVTTHVNGAFFREGNSVVSDLLFPIGDGTRYRPATLEQVPPGATRPIIGFEVVDGAVAGATPGMGVENLVNTRYWHGVVVGGDYQGAKLNLSHKAEEGWLIQNQLVVAQSSTSNGVYVSLDQSGVNGITNNGDVSSEFNAHDGYYMIGQSANLRINLNAFLEGAYSGGTMSDSLFSGAYGNILSANYENGNAASNNYGIEMLNKYAVPNPGVKPVDVVRLTIRDVATPTVDIDETFAWLMSDGSIRDFGSGMKPFATFSDLSLNTTTNYALVVWHRNHVPLMYAISGEMITQSTAAPVMFDVTNSLNIYSVGYKDLGGGDAGMYIGNAEQTLTPLEVNAFDLFVVGNDAKNNLLNSDLYNTDVNLSGETNATDWDKTKWANDQLYYATLP